MPTKPAKYRIPRANGVARYAPANTQSDDRQSFYQGYAWRKFRQQYKAKYRALDEQMINQLISKIAVSFDDVRTFLEDPKKHPLCRHCLKQDRYTPAADLDHIKPYRPEQGMTGFETDNLQWLCRPCHLKKDQPNRYK